MTPVQKLKALRALMKQHDVAAYYVPSADPHLSEYLPEDAKRRAWLSGFTGRFYPYLYRGMCFSMCCRFSQNCAH